MFSAKKQVKTKKKVLKKGFCGIFLQLTTSARRHQSTNQRKNLSWAILKPLAGHFWPAGRGLDALALDHELMQCKNFCKIILFCCHKISKQRVANGAESNGLDLFLRIREIVEQGLEHLVITSSLVLISSKKAISSSISLMTSCNTNINIIKNRPSYLLLYVRFHLNFGLLYDYLSNVLEYHQKGSLADFLNNSFFQISNQSLQTSPCWVPSLKRQIAYEVSGIFTKFTVKTD